MSDGSSFGGLPSFTGGDAGLSPSIQEWLQNQQLAQAQGQGTSQDVPQATPPGFTGYQPQTPPTAAPPRPSCSRRPPRSPLQP